MDIKQMYIKPSYCTLTKIFVKLGYYRIRRWVHNITGRSLVNLAMHSWGAVEAQLRQS